MENRAPVLLATVIGLLVCGACGACGACGGKTEGADQSVTTDSELQGYLVSNASQVLPSLVHLGNGCHLDLYLCPSSRNRGGKSPGCQATSSCLFAKFPESASDQGHVRVIGHLESMESCAVTSKGGGGAMTCTMVDILVPTEVTH